MIAAKPIIPLPAARIRVNRHFDIHRIIEI
jgi:hypothetical protein